MGGTYWSARLPVRGPPTTERFRQKSTVGGRLREKSTVGGRLRKKKGRRRGKQKKKNEGKKEYLARAPSSPAYCRGPRVGRGRGRFLSCARRRSVSPRGETDRGDKKREKKKREQKRENKNLESRAALRPWAISSPHAGRWNDATSLR
ncbi:hypothetical protein GW17_00035294 [Ensete ventricosum]|nr:hypothetical protein GW17_00035294 [Ensete ventricosum]